jgi:hypothetical protein
MFSYEYEKDTRQENVAKIAQFRCQFFSLFGSLFCNKLHNRITFGWKNRRAWNIVYFGKFQFRC